MPIYAYKCDSCGFAKDVLQKMSDPLLEICPSCAKATFTKQVTAAGFQLKGSGWYATDFKGSGSPPAVAPKADGAAPAAAASDAGAATTSKTESSKTESASSGSGEAAPAKAAAPTPSAAPPAAAPSSGS
jgi:putative FmdB family regulatory protein